MRSVGALGSGGGRFEELAIEVVAGCGLQLPKLRPLSPPPPWWALLLGPKQLHVIPLWAALPAAVCSQIWWLTDA